MLPAAIIVLLLIAVAVYARFIEPNIIIVRRVRINRQLNLGTDKPLRISLLSDFHYPRYAHQKLVRRAIELSNQFDPDLVFILGDFFDKNKNDPAVLPNNVGTVFSGIQSRFGVFGVLGNHDHWFDEEAIRNLLASETNIQLVDNSSVPISLPRGVLYIAGVGDLWSQNVDYKRAVANVPQSSPILLLSHNPDVVELLHDPRILIRFSGHTHGGQIRLPFIGALRVPSAFGNRYAKGLVTRGNHPLYVNCGICSMKRIRFLCPPETTWVELY